MDQLLRDKTAKRLYSSDIKGTLTVCGTCLDAKSVLFLRELAKTEKQAS